jgi:hypothetical protein
VLARGFRPRPNLRVFPGGWCPEAEAFKPASIAGSKENLSGLLGKSVPSLTHALIVVLRPREKRLTQAERERYWRAFGVPLYEEIIDSAGKLLARECEAHDGLHVEFPGVAAPDHDLETASCGCGRKTPRLRFTGQAELERVAAYAR